MAVRAEVRVTGLAETRRSLKRMDDDLPKQLATELKAVAETVVSDARSRVPVRKGKARDSLRVTGGATVYINGGKAAVPYYAWLDFGGDLKPSGGRRNRQSRPFLKRGRFIYPAIDRNRSRIEAAAEKAVADARRSADL